MPNNRQRYNSKPSDENVGQPSYSQRHTNRSYNSIKATNGQSRGTNRSYMQQDGFNKNITSTRPEETNSLKKAVIRNPKSSNKQIDVEQNLPKKNTKKTLKKQVKTQKDPKSKVSKSSKTKKPKMKLKVSKDDFSKVIKSTNRKIAAIACAAVLVGGLGTWALVGRDCSKTMVCESTVDYNKGIGYTFYLGRNGKTIDTIEKNDTVSLKFIQKNLGEENAQQILDEYKKKTTDTYNQTVEKYKKYSFFSSEIKETDSKIVVNYRIRVADDSFSYQKYKDILEAFGMTYFYDSDTDSFTYDEEKFLSDDIPLGSIEDVGCRESQKKLKIKKVSQKASNKKTTSEKTSESEDGGSNG